MHILLVVYAAPLKVFDNSVNFLIAAESELVPMLSVYVGASWVGMGRGRGSIHLAVRVCSHFA